MRKVFSNPVAAGLALLLAVVLWIGFAPTAVGGSTSYAIIEGSSMEPKLHAGDLAVVRRGGEYRRGDVVAYHNRQLEKAVLHRIVGRADGHLVFKGDNNDFLDGARPLPQDTIGRLWFHIPRVGTPVAWLKQPGHTIFVALLLLLGVGWSLAATPPRRRRRRRGGRVRAEVRKRLADVAHAERGEGNAVAVLVCTGAGLLLLGVIALGKDASVSRTVEAAYRQSSQLGYSAEARPGVTYAGGRVVTGQPVFAKLARTVDFRFAYRFSAAGEHAATGRASLVATLSDGAGWTKTLPLALERPFRGDGVALAGTLDLERLGKLVHGFEVETGTGVRDYGLTVSSRVRLHALVDGKQVEERFEPKVDFFFDGLRLAPKRPGLGQFRPEKPGSLTRTEPARVSILGVTIGVQAARALGLTGGVIVLFLAAGLSGRLRSGRREAPALVSPRHAHLIVPLAEPKDLAGASVAEVASIDSLVDLAERYDRLILHEPGPGLGSFLVEEDGVVYRYRPRLPKPSQNGHAPAAVPVP